jgi:hypothetical protein
MAVTYSWKVTGLKTTTVANTSDVVVQTYWKKIGTEGDLDGEFSGATPFSSNNMPANTSFIKAVFVGQYEEHVNEQIQKQIDDKKNPVVDATLPWAPAPNTAISNT